MSSPPWIHIAFPMHTSCHRDTIPNSPYFVSLLSENIPLILSQIRDLFQCLGCLQIRRSTLNSSRSLFSLASPHFQGISVNRMVIGSYPVQYGLSVTSQMFSLHLLSFLQQILSTHVLPPSCLKCFGYS